MNDDFPPFPGARPSACPFDPPPEYAGWREADGLQRVRLSDGSLAWAISRYDDIRAALGDPRISADDRNPNLPLSAAALSRPPAFPRMDDPGHARHRRMLIKDFTLRRINGLRPRIQEIVDGFLEEMTAKGPPADLVQDFALPVPSLVISLLLGVPYEDHEFFQRNSGVLVNPLCSEQDKTQASVALFTYLLELVERRRSDPGDDIVSRLARERVAAGELTAQEAAMSGMTLLVAGHETTAKMISLGTLALLWHPDRLAALRDTGDPAVVANAVDELLRYITLAENLIVRVAAEDVEIGGRLIRAGDGIIFNLLSGNHDPSAFPDPDALDLGRNARGHVAFGYGVHQCLGQPLARAELEIALRGLPGLRLTIPLEKVELRPDLSRYPSELPIAWG
ncbi:cytochrome P450 [Nonomuraea sp. PA05]|uniref:cytochrome P450 n=1 Tax=Nonomuraea sp. PA05 TaxID=2604466 RepID=UPI0011DB675D|nr:cytochrome P450 [Nonomuraea sp. PA05]TYB56168.1 cytochrome P450 [Nonomuraea sp. PA05]